MRAALLLLFVCLAEGDGIRFEFQQFKSQVEAQHAALTLQIIQLKSDLNQEISQLKSEVKKLKDQCPFGWTKFGDRCYYASTDKKTWQQSREYCQNQGADLVVINSREEKDFVVSFAGGKWAWIGMTDRDREGVWKWIDGTQLTSPTYWQPNEPNGGDGEDCVTFYNGEWYDASCWLTAEVIICVK